MSSYKSNQEVYGARSKSAEREAGQPIARCACVRVGDHILMDSETLRNGGKEGASGHGGGGHSAVEQIKKQRATL